MGNRYDFGTGIRIKNSDNTNISDNNIIKNYYGILIDGGSRDTFIHHNVFSNEWSGVYARTATHFMIYDNIVDNNYWGIRIWIEAGHYTISRNTITRNRNGIVDSGYGKNTISENDILYNEDNGIMWGSDDSMTIIRNNISFNGEDGISLTHSSSNNVLISKNIISNNGRHGIFLDLWGCIITKNIIFNHKHGLHLNGSNLNIICNNISNSNTGLYLGNARNTKISMNNFIGNDVNSYFKVVIFFQIRNRWDSNYYDSWSGFGPFIFRGLLYFRWDFYDIYFEFDWFEFDQNPAKEPYDITSTQGCGIE
jgi:parallel beta-helix repeat protein